MSFNFNFNLYVGMLDVFCWLVADNSQVFQITITFHSQKLLTCQLLWFLHWKQHHNTWRNYYKSIFSHTFLDCLQG